MGKKRSASCVANGRDSPGQRLGVKAWGSQMVKSGTIIIRQKGTLFQPGKNVQMGRDHTLYAISQGLVTFKWARGGKRIISVV